MSKQKEVSCFFEIENEYDIVSINGILELSKSKLYGRPGEPLNLHLLIQIITFKIILDTILQVYLGGNLRI